MSYKKLGIMKFGKQLIETGDLDPIYLALWNVKIPKRRLKRLLLAYWWFYHLGVASRLSVYEGREFYDVALQLVKEGVKTPRGTERRHFRGKAAIDAIKFFKKKHDPEVWVDQLREYHTVNDLVSHVSENWPQFGPWIGFKVADMLDRLALSGISFPVETLKMYREPKKGAELVAKKYENFRELDVIGVVEELQNTFEGYKAPPRNNRPCGVQEVETILCKWKSHMTGHYPPGKDTQEIIHGLEGWGKLAGHYRGYLLAYRADH